MATIKINYGGTTYSMIKTSSKMTTPSIAVDGGFIPCFKGDRFAEVKSGLNINTLSPLIVNCYRMACRQRIISLRVYVAATLYGNWLLQGYIYSSRYSVTFGTLYVTDKNGNKLSDYTVSVTRLSNQDTEQELGSQKSSQTWTFSGKVTVKYGSEVILDNSYSLSVTAQSNGVNGGERVEYSKYLLASL